MIIINETPKGDVVEAINDELDHVTGLRDTLSLLNDSGKANVDTLEGYVQRNAVLKSIESQLKQSLSPRATLISALENSTEQLALWIPKLSDRINKGSTKVFDRETVTFKEKGILDIVAGINFFNRYATMVLDILLSQANKEERLENYLGKVDFAFFNSTSKYFAHLLVKFSESVKNLEAQIDALSDETYDSASEEIISAQLGASAVSVKNMAPHELNPLHWYKRRQMKGDVKTLVKSGQDIDMLAMKIARLNNRRNGTDNPDLDRQIETYQDAILKKRANMVRIESKYNGNRV
ncbi:putative virion structural protein [Pseudomonas phage OBP]|uniref:putative virion structural protein n=1 Tax=Pseudomonas phage OBP TaxID=1124849 RepID=UPI000240D499|nr:putative virion structural protein [Pseudomonas phage OBP]AEV89544.1 putative virion structural protein [Pseudomonas phage OBP]